MKEDDKWVGNLRNKLEDYSEPLPDALWERLEEELSAPRVIPMWRTRRFVAAAAVLVVAVSSLTFWFINSPTADYMRSNEALVEELDFSSTPDDEVLSSSEKIFSSDNSKIDSSLNLLERTGGSGGNFSFGDGVGISFFHGRHVFFGEFCFLLHFCCCICHCVRQGRWHLHGTAYVSSDGMDTANASTQE